MVYAEWKIAAGRNCRANGRSFFKRNPKELKTKSEKLKIELSLTNCASFDKHILRQAQDDKALSR
ncbi:hypothetical protein LBMAG27_20520 [Bacteroidota bacterium]|nr:hypothetical protein LBMAG27_20520 [Bacteroidota bacterium]